MGKYLKFLQNIFNINTDNNDHEAVITCLEQALSEVCDDASLTKHELMLATSSDDWLEEWGSWFNISRLPNEDDDHLRERILSSMDDRISIPAIKRGIKKVLGDNVEVDIYETYNGLRFFNRATFSGWGRYPNEDYWRIGVIDITINTEQEISKDLINYIKSLTGAGILCYVHDNNLFDLTRETTNLTSSYNSNYLIDSKDRFGAIVYGSYAYTSCVVSSLKHNKLYKLKATIDNPKSLKCGFFYTDRDIKTATIDTSDSAYLIIDTDIEQGKSYYLTADVYNPSRLSCGFKYDNNNALGLTFRSGGSSDIRTSISFKACIPLDVSTFNGSPILYTDLVANISPNSQKVGVSDVKFSNISVISVNTIPSINVVQYAQAKEAEENHSLTINELSGARSFNKSTFSGTGRFSGAIKMLSLNSSYLVKDVIEGETYYLRATLNNPLSLKCILKYDSGGEKQIISSDKSFKIAIQLKAINYNDTPSLYLELQAQAQAPYNESISVDDAKVFLSNVTVERMTKSNFISISDFYTTNYCLVENVEANTDYLLIADIENPYGIECGLKYDSSDNRLGVTFKKQSDYATSSSRKFRVMLPVTSVPYNGSYVLYAEMFSKNPSSKVDVTFSNIKAVKITDSNFVIDKHTDIIQSEEQCVLSTELLSDNNGNLHFGFYSNQSSDDNIGSVVTFSDIKLTSIT